MTPVRYQPEFLYAEGRLHRGRALTVDGEGCVASGQVDGGEAIALPGRALFPGLVNAHSHAFQRLLRGRVQVSAGRTTDDFWSWREQMYRAASVLGPEELYAVCRQTFLEMAFAGVTAVGEFHYLHHQPDGRRYADRQELAWQVLRAAREVGLRIVLLRVGYARAGFGVSANPRQARFIDESVDAFLAAVEELSAKNRDPLATVGMAPHSVRAVPKEWMEALGKLPPRLTHLHVAEQPKEVEACLAEHRRRPVELLADVGLLHAQMTAVHGIHLTVEEVSALGRATAAVCACPSTERDLGDGVVPADALATAGVTLALGSDSQAQVDLLDEARQLEGHLRLIRGRRGVLDPVGLFQAATRGGARSLGLPTGELVPGAPADFFTVDLSHPSLVGVAEEALLPAVVFGAEKAAVREVAVQGQLIVREGHHPLAEDIGRSYLEVARRLI